MSKRDELITELLQQLEKTVLLIHKVAAEMNASSAEEVPALFDPKPVPAPSGDFGKAPDISGAHPLASKAGEKASAPPEGKEEPVEEPHGPDAPHDPDWEKKLIQDLYG